MLRLPGTEGEDTIVVRHEDDPTKYVQRSVNMRDATRVFDIRRESVTSTQSMWRLASNGKALTEKKGPWKQEQSCDSYLLPASNECNIFRHCRQMSST